jgi:hypothetical protein
VEEAGRQAAAVPATEDFAVYEVAFAWRARFPLLGPLGLDVVDELRDGAFQPTPWAATSAATRASGTSACRAAAETWWDFPEGRFVYWRGRVTRVEATSS